MIRVPSPFPSQRFAGECEVVDGKVAGIAVHTGARIASLATPGEVLVSSTVKDLVAGSGITFEDRGHGSSKASLGSGTATPSHTERQGRTAHAGTADSRRKRL